MRVGQPEDSLPSSVPCAPGRSPFHGKGLLYIGALDDFERSIPGGMAAVRACLLDDELRAFFAQQFLAASYYDLLPIMPLMSAAARARGVPVAQLLDERGRDQAMRDVAGVRRAHFLRATPESVVERIPRVSAQYFDFGEIRLEEVGPGSVSARQMSMPALLRAWYMRATAAYMRGALEAVGARDVEVVWRGSELVGEREGFQMVSIPLEIRWK